LAKISRPVYYQMAQWAMESGGDAQERSKGNRSQIGLWSADMFFPFETEKI